MKNDWRLTNQIKYLYNKKIVATSFVSSNDCDHKHCSFCWHKFDSLNFHGYCTLDGKHWICEECFNDFKDLFKWEVIGTQEKAGDG